jgi:hypothetical protein
VTAVKKLTSKRGEDHLYLVRNMKGHPVELTRSDVALLALHDEDYGGDYASVLAAIDAMEAGS